MDDALKVGTETVEVTLSFLDGLNETVVVPIPTHDEHRTSRVRRLVGFFNVREAFVAVRRTDDGGTIIIRKSRIRWVEVLRGATPSDEDRAGIAQRISIRFPMGFLAHGTVYNDLPAGRQRVRDFLNQPDPFFFLETDQRLLLVNRETASRVYDPPLG